jgi:hypothetical protein
MVLNVFIIYKKTHVVLAIKGEKKDETKVEEGRRRGRGEKVTREERKKTKGEGKVRKRKQREEKLKKLKRRTRGGRKRTR